MYGKIEEKGQYYYRKDSRIGVNNENNVITNRPIIKSEVSPPSIWHNITFNLLVPSLLYSSFPPFCDVSTLWHQLRTPAAVYGPTGDIIVKLGPWLLSCTPPIPKIWSAIIFKTYPLSYCSSLLIIYRAVMSTWMQRFPLSLAWTLFWMSYVFCSWFSGFWWHYFHSHYRLLISFCYSITSRVYFHLAPIACAGVAC